MSRRRLATPPLVVMVILFAGACVRTRHREVKDADGQANVLIKCDKHKPEKCKKRASEVCRGDYSVEDELQPDPKSSLELMMTVHCRGMHE